MRIVTSTPRSGSSLVMQTMVLLGIESPAPPFLPEHKDMKEFNLGGFYEFNLMDGIRNDRYRGMAVKLFGGQLAKTEKRFISKLIWVRRNKAEAVKSYDKIRVHLPYSSATSEEIYDANWNLIKKCMGADSVTVELEDIKESPKQFVSDLINYLDIYPSADQIQRAVSNIKRVKQPILTI